MTRPLISIITVCFNSEKTIRRTIESVLNQDFLNYEFLIIDGASSDHTVDIAKTYESQFQGRMRIYSEPDKGIYDAFNKGIQRSHGVYCWLVNSDDYIEPNALSRIAMAYDSKEGDDEPILVGALNFVSQDGRILSTSGFDSSNVKLGYKWDYIGVPHPSTLVPKKIYDKYGCFDTYYRIIGDADWFRRVCMAGVRFKGIDAILTNMTDGGISNQFNYRKSLKDRIHYLNKFYKNPIQWLYHWAVWTKSFYVQKNNSKIRRNAKE